MIRTLFATASSAALLAACSTALQPPPTVPPPPPCPITSSSDWRAWVDAMPGPGARPTLIVSGRATFPTGGWRVSWGDMRVMESYPVQIAIDLDPIPPAGGATEAIVTQDVRGEWPVSPPVGSVTVYCRGTLLARISPVETAH